MDWHYSTNGFCAFRKFSLHSKIATMKLLFQCSSPEFMRSASALGGRFYENYAKKDITKNVIFRAGPRG